MPNRRDLLRLGAAAASATTFASPHLARAQARLKKWLINSEERDRVRDEIHLLEVSITHLESERAKRR